MKIFKFIVIGYGSIGRRHVKNILSLKKKFYLAVFTKQKINNIKTFYNLREIINFNPDYIIISTSTSYHYKYIKFIEKNFINKKILVEKPLFNKINKIRIAKNQIYVGYNLRFHPLIDFIKKNIINKKIWNVTLSCNSYLPNWRKNIVYSKSSSAIKKRGGGVLFDLCHEIDILIYCFKNFSIDYVFNKKISDLKIETDDILILNGKIMKSVPFQLHLNYFSKILVRKINIQGKNFNCEVDLINNIGSYFINNKLIRKKLKNFDSNKTYLNQFKAFLNNDTRKICTYQEGIKNVKMLDKIKNF